MPRAHANRLHDYCCVLFLALVCALGAVATAFAGAEPPSSCKRQAADTHRLRPRWRPDKTRPPVLYKGRNPRLLVLKLQDDICAFAQKGQLSSPNGDKAVLEVVSVLADVPGITVEREFDFSDKQLESVRRTGEKNIGQELADMRQYYWLRLKDATYTRALMGKLLALQAVENVYAASLPTPLPGDIGVFTPDFTAQQHYHDPAPVGIDVPFAMAEFGSAATGAGLMIVDVEYAWNFPHEDLTTIAPGADYLGESPNGNGDYTANFTPCPVPYNPAAEPCIDPDRLENARNHGTAVVGILAADDDAFGIRGIVPDARVMGLSTFETANYGVAGAISSMLYHPTLHVAEADLKSLIILLEAQTAGPYYNPNILSQQGLLPVEYDQVAFDLIQTATAQGVRIIEAAGNGGQDLDSGHVSYDVFDPTVRHSGAIMIGSASSSVPHAPRPSSNYGRRVDAYGWGEHIVTLGYGPNHQGNPHPSGSGNENEWYTATFGGTSGASPIVTGAVAILGAYHTQRHEQAFDPMATRLLLRTTGTESQNPTNDRIGRMPDLRVQLPVVAMGPNPAAVLTGNPSKQLGYSMAPIDDVNGDDVGDLILGAPGFGPGGYVEIYSGLTGDRVIRIDPEPSEVQFGAAVAAIEDVDGDGWSDVLIGAPNPSDPGHGSASIYSSATGALLWRAVSETPYDGFGKAVASLHDLNGDGLPEVVVGAPDHNASRGAVYVIYTNGQTNNLISTSSAQVAWFHTGSEEDMRFGDVVVTGDVELGDGIREVIVAAPQYDMLGAGSDSGMVVVYRAHNGSVGQVLYGTSQAARFGTAIAIVQDIDGDRIADLAIGAPGEEAGRGAVFTYSGDSGRFLQFAMGRNRFEGFGSAVASLGDLNNDGYPELIVGAPNGGDTQSGTAYAVTIDGQWWQQYTGQNPGDRFGHTVISLDINGDGLKDPAIAATSSAENGQSAGGRVYEFLSTPIASTP